MSTPCLMYNMEPRAQLLHSGPLLGALVAMLWLEGLCSYISMWACASRGRIRESTRWYTEKCAHSTGSSVSTVEKGQSTGWGKGNFPCISYMVQIIFSPFDAIYSGLEWHWDALCVIIPLAPCEGSCLALICNSTPPLHSLWAAALAVFGAGQLAFDWSWLLGREQELRRWMSSCNKNIWLYLSFLLF